MTRKDYEKIADWLHAIRVITTWGTSEQVQQRIDVVIGRIIGELAADNPRFDRARFLAAVNRP